MSVLIALTETDKRVLFALLLIIILLFVLCGYLGMLVRRIMKSQGKKLDYYIADPVTTRVIKDQKHFVKYARKKNAYLFYRKAKWPMLVLIISVLALVINNIWLGWNYNPFADVNKGFASLMFLWDFNDPSCWIRFFETNIYLLIKWPAKFHDPTFHIESLGVYLFVIGVFVGGFWYLHQVTAFIARKLRIGHLKRVIYGKDLDGYAEMLRITQQQNQLGNNAQQNNNAQPNLEQSQQNNNNQQ